MKQNCIEVLYTVDKFYYVNIMFNNLAAQMTITKSPEDKHYSKILHI